MRLEVPWRRSVGSQTLPRHPTASRDSQERGQATSGRGAEGKKPTSQERQELYVAQHQSLQTLSLGCVPSVSPVAMIRASKLAPKLFDWAMAGRWRRIRASSASQLGTTLV